MAQVRAYASLRNAVRKMLREGDEAGTVKRVAWYYGIWEMIGTHILGHGDRAAYGKEVIQRLYEMLNVRWAYPISRPAGKLTWTHYLALATIEDEGLRAAYEAHAARGSWSRRMQRVRIREGLLQAGDGNFLADLDRCLPQTPRRGAPYTYRVKEATPGRLLLDLGMGAEHALDVKASSVFEPGDVVKANRNGGLYEVEPGDSGNLYTFKATVTRVVDGDTLWARMDYGFRFFQPWKVRFRGVDAPELPTDEGLAAKAWVEARLSGRPFEVMTTTKVGMYGRYIADVFYPPSPPPSRPGPLPPSPRLRWTGRRARGQGRTGGKWSAEEVARRGRYLNGEMVEAGVGVRA